MKATNLSVFYQIGASITYLTDHAHIGDKAVDLFVLIQIPCKWLVAFRWESTDLEDAFRETLAAVEGLIGMIHGLMDSIPKDWNRLVTQAEVQALFYWKDKFEEAFEREHRNIDVFTVTPKGIYNTRLLMEKPEEKFPKDLRSVFSSIVMYDLQQAGRCLAFELPTAVAFHLFRATQAVMDAYYEAKAGKPWEIDRREWGRYITEIEKLPNANRDVTSRLREIGKFERNPTIHEDVMVSLEKAPVLFELCTGAIYTMAVEIKAHTEK
jgi:hypothetical protein